MEFFFQVFCKDCCSINTPSQPDCFSLLLGPSASFILPILLQALTLTLSSSLHFFSPSSSLSSCVAVWCHHQGANVPYPQGAAFLLSDAHSTNETKADTLWSRHLPTPQQFLPTIQPACASKLREVLGLALTFNIILSNLIFSESTLNIFKFTLQHLPGNKGYHYCNLKMSDHLLLVEEERTLQF